MKLFKRLSLFGLAILLITAVPMDASAQTTNAPAAKEKPSKKAAKPEPKVAAFKGKLASMDKTAKTITVDEKAKQVLEITSDTLITKDGKPAILADGAMGDAVTGTYKKSEDGKLSALTVNFGEKAQPVKAATKPKKKISSDAETNATATPVVPAAPVAPATNAPAP